LDVNGTSYDIPKDKTNEIWDDKFVYLSDKDFLEKWSKELLKEDFEKKFEVDDFDEDGKYRNPLNITQTYSFKTNDGGEAVWDFWGNEDTDGVLDITDKSPEALELETLLNKYVGPVEDLDSLFEKLLKVEKPIEKKEEEMKAGSYASLKIAIEPIEEKVTYKTTPVKPKGLAPEKIVLAKGILEKTIQELENNQNKLEGIEKDIETKTADLEKQKKELNEKIKKKELQIKETGKFLEIKNQIDALADSLYKLVETQNKTGELKEPNIRLGNRLINVQRLIREGTVPSEDKLKFVIEKLSDFEGVQDKIKKALYDYERNHKSANVISKKILDIGITENFAKELETVPVEGSVKTAGFLDWIKGMLNALGNFLSNLIAKANETLKFYNQADNIVGEIETQLT
jgi:hypothetical protein